MLSCTASGHDSCCGARGVVTEILEGLVWRRRSGWADGRKRVPRDVRRPFIKHFQVSQDEELHCSSCRYTCRKCKLEVRAQRLRAFQPFGFPPVHSSEALHRHRLQYVFLCYSYTSSLSYEPLWYCLTFSRLMTHIYVVPHR
jgi:hypothetical protein